jgi:hypothetical protein
MLQYVLLVIIVFAMFIVIVVSAKDYSPVEWTILAFFMIVISIVGSNYFFGVNVATSLKNITTGKPEIGVEVVNQEKESGELASSVNKQEVFHVPGQFDYSEARALCRAYGGNLANIEQMMEAYENGAEWCNYGWSEDKMALYPTQTSTWKSFKSVEGHEKDCGRPGVNGGYTMDLKQLLGANCFAPKPAQDNLEIQPPPFPTNPLDEEALKYKDNLPNVSPFNYTKWSQ